MSVKIFHGGWNPFNETNFECGTTVSISIDTTQFDPHSNIKILCIIEPPDIKPQLYHQAPDFYRQFNKIYSYSSSLVRDYKNVELTPYGTIWIEKKDVQEDDKENFVSFLTSSKNYASGHIFRQAVYEFLSYNNKFNNFKTLYHKSPPWLAKREIFFYKPKFSIVVENCKYPNFFTEKLLDCFACNTIPIYNGCPNIDEYFNKEGILMFNSIDELNNILYNNDLNLLYHNKQKAIKDNYKFVDNWAGNNHIANRLIRNIKECISNNDIV